MRRSLSIFERMEYVSRTMRELIMDVWPESGAQATARGRCATGIGLDSQSVPAPAISGYEITEEEEAHRRQAPQLALLDLALARPISEQLRQIRSGTDKDGPDGAPSLSPGADKSSYGSQRRVPRL
jgi:hypothetical protein